MGLFKVSCVRSVSLDFVAEGCDLIDCLLSVLVYYEVGESDVGPLGSEPHCDGLSDSSSCARNEGDFSIKKSHFNIRF